MLPMIAKVAPTITTTMVAKTALFVRIDNPATITTNTAIISKTIVALDESESLFIPFWSIQRRVAKEAVDPFAISISPKCELCT